MGIFSVMEDLKKMGFKPTHSEKGISLFHNGTYELQLKKADEETFSDVMKEYSDDLEKFGFGIYAIDFSNVSLKDTKALCEFIRRQNAKRGGK